MLFHDPYKGSNETELKFCKKIKFDSHLSQYCPSKKKEHEHRKPNEVLSQLPPLSHKKFPRQASSTVLTKKNLSKRIIWFCSAYNVSLLTVLTHMWQEHGGLNITERTNSFARIWVGGKYKDVWIFVDCVPLYLMTNIEYLLWCVSEIFPLNIVIWR